MLFALLPKYLLSGRNNFSDETDFKQNKRKWNLLIEIKIINMKTIYKNHNNALIFS